MQARLVICAMVAGCGFPKLPAVGDGSNGGSDGDGSSQPADCFAAWMKHEVQIGPATEVAELTMSNGFSRNPWISVDGLRMYFVSDQLTPGSGDIYFTSRPDKDKTTRFAPPMKVSEVSSPQDEGRPWLTPDEKTIVLPRERSGHHDILMATWAGGSFGTPTDEHLTTVNMAGTQRTDASLSLDGLRLYLAADYKIQQDTRILVAKRSIATDDFGTPSEVPGTDQYPGSLGDPLLYQDEQLLVFSTVMGGADTADLFYATLDSGTGKFGMPVPIPSVNQTGTAEMDIVLTADGCELYFASNRNDMKFHIFHAEVTR